MAAWRKYLQSLRGPDSDPGWGSQSRRIGQVAPVSPPPVAIQRLSRRKDQAAATAGLVRRKLNRLASQRRRSIRELAEQTCHFEAQAEQKHLQQVAQTPQPLATVKPAAQMSPIREQLAARKHLIAGQAAHFPAGCTDTQVCLSFAPWF